jgi:hypothetical protein
VWMDLDFFFVGDSLSPAQADVMLKRIHELVRSQHPETHPQDVTLENECATTFVRSRRMYQFVHRIYPSPLHVIGGFDLGPGMVYYDGVALWTTPFGAFSIANGVIIGDTSRRSSTYEARIAKYVRSKGMSLVLCNTIETRVCQYVQEHLDGLIAGGISLQIVRFLMVQVNVRKALLVAGGTRHFDVGELFTIQHRTKEEQLCDYALHVQEFRLRDLERYNVRAALKGQLHLLTWKYDRSDGRKVLYCAAPDFKNTVVPNAAKTHFVVPLSVVKHWWPLVDVSTHDMVQCEVVEEMGYELTIEEVNHLWNQTMESVSAVRGMPPPKGIKWITENPGRQWTSAVNPIPTGHDWYHKDLRIHWSIS